MKRDFLTLQDINQDEMWQLFEVAAKMKKERMTYAGKPLAGKSIGLIFAKSSTRTRVSFEVGVHELGGNPLYLDQGKMQLGRGSETIGDTAKVLSRYLHGSCLPCARGAFGEYPLHSCKFVLTKYFECVID